MLFKQNHQAVCTKHPRPNETLEKAVDLKAESIANTNMSPQSPQVLTQLLDFSFTWSTIIMQARMIFYFS